MRGEPNVALTFFGDGATNIGTFHEALNMAAVWKAPVVFIITNNLYGEYSPAGDDHGGRRTSPAAPIRTACPGIIVDGQDVDAVHAAVGEAVERARAGDGPSLLEMKTYRYRGHSPHATRPSTGRTASSRRGRRATRSSILGARLAAEGILSADDQARIARGDPGRDRRRRRARRGSPVPDPRGDALVCLR